MLKNVKKLALGTILVLATTQATANDVTNTLSEKGIYLGFQSASLSYSHGLSAKMDFTDKITGQAILGFLGTFNTYTARGLYKFNQDRFYNMYGYGSVGLWSWDGGRYWDDETSMTFGGGAGFEYDIRGLGADKNFPVFINAELGLNIVNFDNYGSVSTLGLGIGVHYKF